MSGAGWHTLKIMPKIIDEFLFIKTKGERKYCYFQNNRQSKDSAFVVIFALGADNYDQLYWWGRNEDQAIISIYHALSYAPDDIDNEWQMIDMKKKDDIGNFDKIVKQASKEVESLKNMKDQM